MDPSSNKATYSRDYFLGSIVVLARITCHSSALRTEVLQPFHVYL